MAAPNTLAALEKGLTIYYAKFNKQYNGGIKTYMDECGFEDDELLNDFAVSLDDLDDCTILFDFDGINDFPLDPKINNADAQKEKFKIMKRCYETGQPSASISATTIKLATTHIKANDIKRASQIYADQTPNIYATCATEPDVMYLLAARSKNNNFPVIQTMHDAFTRDKLDAPALELEAWLHNLPLYKKLSNTAATHLSAGMKGFVNRICPLMLLNSQSFIDDDPARIANYVASTSQFITKLLEKEKAVPPFQVDMIIAVKDVKSNVDDDNDDNSDIDDGDDDDDDDDKNDDISNDIAIGNVVDKLTKNKCAFHSQPVDDVKEDTLRPMMALYKAFRGKLNNSNNKPSPNDNKKTYHKSFNDAAYPQNKRFNIFIDRRKDLPKDKVTFFEPPHYCDTLPNNGKDPYAPEWFIESARQCLIPDKGPDNNINVTDAYKGEIITFSFHVEAEDKIKCYMFWSGQVQRFYPEDLVKVFKYVFYPDKYNNFIKSGAVSKIAKNIHIVDKEFESFYTSLTKKEFPNKINSLLKNK